jgi:hypothetical protein
MPSEDYNLKVNKDLKFRHLSQFTVLVNIISDGNG